MLLQWSAPEYMPHSFQVSGLSGTVGHKQTGNCFDLTKQVADGFVGMQELFKGLFLVQSEMAFKRETELYEEYPERKVFQLSFCMSLVRPGLMVAEKCGAQMLDGMYLCGIHHRFIVGAGHADVEGSDRIVIDIIDTGDVKPGNQADMVYGKTFYFFHNQTTPFYTSVITSIPAFF